MENRVRPAPSIHRLVPAVAAALLAFAVAAPGVAQQRNKLPDIGSSAGEMLGPSQQEQYVKDFQAVVRSGLLLGIAPAELRTMLTAAMADFRATSKESR